MHCTKFLFVVVCLAVWPSLAGAQPKDIPSITVRVNEPAKPADPTPEPPASTETPKPADAVAGDPETITLILLDGSVIAGKLSLKEIAIDTQFGKLSVPVTNIRSFIPGLGSHPDLGSNLQTLIKNLGSTTFAEREAAQKALLKIGPAARIELQRFVDDTDTERRTRVKAILEEFDQAAEDDEGGSKPTGYTQRDVIETTDFTIAGKIVPTSFEIKTLYGQLNVKLSDIQRAQRSIQQKENLQKAFVVEGTQMLPRAIKSTNLKLEKGDKVTISAEGTIVMTPWGNQAMSTPEGSQNYGWYIPNQIAAGALVGRIGTNGPIFKVGSKSNFTADRTGILYLAIGMEPSNVNNVFPGEYKTKIKVEKK